jgi:subtilisin-like proprotein convertase family protein
MWLSLSMLFFLAAVYFWHLGDKWAAQKGKTPASNATNQVLPAETPNKPTTHSKAEPLREPAQLLSAAGHVNSPPTQGTVKTNQNSRLAYRLSNTTQPLARLIHSDRAVLLENALIDTKNNGALAIPDALKSQGDPGSYIVQARGSLDNNFRALLNSAGATVVSYVPNNAYLVRASEAVAQQLQADPQTQSVLPYEPYYKLKPSLLRLAVEQQPLPDDSVLNVLAFSDARQAAIDALQSLGAEILSEDRSPFGPVLKIRPPADSLAAIAGLSAVQEVEPARTRRLANDLSRVTAGVSLDTQTDTNYLGLTGAKILVNVNDTGVDSTHPDLKGRVEADFPGNEVDTDGHGTHVAGIIAGDGTQSSTVTNAVGSLNPGVSKQYRGKAPGATLFSMQLTQPDSYLQETAARTNALISNNSWTYGIADYDLAAASFDAAVRDSVPEIPGSQALLYVFPSGNEGGANGFDAGNDGGSGGNADTVESPGTAKNVITVGAVEQFRDVTNQTVICDPIFGCITNQPWLPSTDSSNQITGFSGRGNVGIGIEGDFGRFKPDVVAPGTFIISTRSARWDQTAYYNPTNYSTQSGQLLTLSPFSAYNSTIFVPNNAVQLIVSGIAVTPFMNLPVYVSTSGGPTFSANNQVSITDGSLTPPDSFWNYSISNNSAQTVTFNWQTTLVTTNQQGNFFQVLRNMNDSLGGFYRYESGTSLAAADVSGVLALMEEFFAVRLQVTNSPALMKALLINGARSVGTAYDFQVQNGINYQGWGEVFLPTTLPGVLSNITSSAAASSIYVFDQDPTNALATGQSHTRFFSLTPDGQAQPLRITVAWTDPPGNPAAGVKLVNDLDLVVTNLDTGDVFFGNDILAGNQFNMPWGTNTFPNVDVVNNVENVYLNQPLGTNYSITVIGHHVNVNAVTRNPNDVVQDYALVVSSGDGAFPAALSLTSDPGKTLTLDMPNVYFMTNTFPFDPENPISGGLLLDQHVGANSPLLGTNTVPLTGDTNAVITIGMTNQWHFYVLSNDFNFTNVSFVTFMPPELAVPRMGVTNVDNPNSATRPEADIDLYVSTDPGLTNLSPVAIAGADKSVGRGGTEVIVKDNAAPGAVYYVGVKSEDQQAAEYSFLGVFSLLPPDTSDANGNVLMRGVPVPAVIPPGVPPKPRAALVLGIDTRPIQVRRVVVTNSFTHSMPGNLLGNLSHDTTFVVLNNHTCAVDPFGNCYTNRHDYIYEDNGENNVPFSRSSDGPGNLKDFIGKPGLGVWLLSMVNSFPAGTGEVDRLTIKLEPQNLNTNGVQVDLLPNSWFYDAIDVPGDATNLTVCVSGNTAPIDLYVSRTAPPTTNSFDYHLQINPPGGCLPITIFDNPPLSAGTYYIGVYNGSFIVQHIHVTAQIFINPFAIASSFAGSGSPVPILDDAVTYAYITNLTHMPISSLDVGLLISDPRISDLAITLVSPDGTRVLLFENRGANSTSGLGTFNLGGNAVGHASLTPFYTNNFDGVPVGPYSPGAVFDGWNVLQDRVTVFPELPAPWLSNNVVILNEGIISNNLPTDISTSYSLSFAAAHAPYLVGTVAWWPFDGNGLDIVGGFNGTILGDVLFNPLGKVNQALSTDGIAARMIVPRAPKLDVGRGNGFSIEGWINPRSVVASTPFFQWADPVAAANSGVVFGIAPQGVIYADIWDTTRQVHSVQGPSGAITNGGWQHVAMSYDGSTLTGRLYTNGVLAVAQIFTNNFVPETAGDLFFAWDGRAVQNENFGGFNGGMDEFALYDRPLSDCEVAAIYNAGSGGKYGTNVLTCPVIGTVQLLTSLGPVNAKFTNGVTWAVNSIPFSTLPPAPGQNFTPITVTSLDPNLAVDNFVLSTLTTNYTSSLMDFTENTNLALIPIKFAPAPYSLSNLPPTLIFSNHFENVFPGLYSVNSTLPGTSNSPAIGVHNWTVLNGPVTVVSNTLVNAAGTNSVALGTGGLQCDLPTIPGNRYRLDYTVRGPGMVSWWNGDIEPLSQRAWDLISGNNGAFIDGASNSPAGYVNVRGDTQALYLPGVINAPNDLVSKIEIGDPANLRLTNSFTIEGWIKPVSISNFLNEQTEQILFRGDSRQCLDPYYFGVERVSGNRLDLVFHIEDNKTGDCGIILESANQPVLADQWQHVAAVFEANVFWATNAGWPTNELRLYLNGQQLTPQNNAVFMEDPSQLSLINSGFTGKFPFADLDPSFSPGVAIGNQSRTENSEPFHGYIDELSVYGRALTGPEIAAIAAAGVNGKSDVALPPGQGLAKLAVLANNVQIDVGYGDNSQWTPHSVEFTADSTNVVLTLQSLLPGTIVDGVNLTELPAELHYLPEDSLAALNGQDAYGIWTLEILDSRTGANVAPNSASLLDWQLNFVLQPSNAPPVVHLQHGIIYTNTLVAGGIQNLQVDVPQWAAIATNILVAATDASLVNPLPVGVLWSSISPSPGAIAQAIVWPPNSTGSKVLYSTTTPPDIIPGQPYYLTITNPNPVAVTFAYGVWFDIQSLTNCLPYSNFVPQAGVPRYLQFDVPTNTPGPVPQAVTIYLTGVQSNLTGIRSNLTVVLSEHLPLPDLTHYDYISSSPATNDAILMLVTNTTPFPIQTNRWYIGLFSQADTAVPFQVEACASPAYPTIVPLTNAVPFVANFTNPFVAPPGPPRQFFFQFQITNEVDAFLFELYHLSGNANLVLQRDGPPTMAPYYAGSFEPGTNWQQIVVRVSPDVPSLVGNWYVGIYNNETTNVSYSLRAAVSSNGTLLSVLEPPVPTVSALGNVPGAVLSWYSVAGEYYEVDSTLRNAPPNWQPVPGFIIRATTPLTTFVVQVQAGNLDIYRVVHLSSHNLPTAPLQIELWTNNTVRISWSSVFQLGILQFADSPLGPWFNANLPIDVVPPFVYAFDAIGPIPKFYRLLQ